MIEGLFDVEEAGGYLPSPGEVAAASTNDAGWSRATLAEWGVPWPPPKGWKSDLERRWRERGGHDGRAAGAVGAGTAAGP